MIAPSLSQLSAVCSSAVTQDPKVRSASSSAPSEGPDVDFI